MRSAASSRRTTPRTIGRGKSSIAERLQDFFNGGNRAELRLLHALTRMRGLLERTMRPITAAQSVCDFLEALQNGLLIFRRHAQQQAAAGLRVRQQSLLGIA